MKLNLLGTTVILLVAFLPRYECRAIDSPGAAAQSAQPQSPQSSGPILERLGEEYFIRLGNGNTNNNDDGNSNFLGSLPSPMWYHPRGHGSVYNRAAQLHRLLQDKAGLLRARLVGGLANRDASEEEEEEERGRRSEEPPISLDLTFHLLREMMEMSRAENLAQQAQNNRRMMELFGKK